MKKLVLKKIKKRKLEDLSLLSEFNEILRQQRGSVFSMPKKGSTVAAFFSGGLDSTITTSLLLGKYGLNVIPFHFVRPTCPFSDPIIMKNAARFFEDYFKKVYPTQFRDVVYLDLTFPPTSYFQAIYDQGLNIVDRVTKQRQGIPFQIPVFFFTIIDYLLSKNINFVNTIFASDLADTVDYYAYSSLTSYRAMNVSICTMLKNFSWQTVSLPMEAEMGFYMEKGDYLRFHKDTGLSFPYEHTRTCQHNYRYHCGECLVCHTRQAAFLKAAIPDETIYETMRTDVIGKIKQLHSTTKQLFQNF